MIKVMVQEMVTIHVAAQSWDISCNGGSIFQPMNCYLYIMFHLRNHYVIVGRQLP